jgi:Tfp pilus assembly protein PilO
MDINLSKNINMGLPPQMPSARNFLLEVALFAVVCGLFFWFIVLPKQAIVSAKNEELSQYLEAQSKTAGDLQTFKRLVGELKSHPNDIKKLDDAIPLAGKATYLQMLIETLANSSGVTIGSINVAGKNDAVAAGDTQLINNPFKASRSLQKLSGTVYVIGTLPQLMAFLKKVETSGRVMQISSISVGPAQDNNLSLNVSLDAFYFAP